MHAYGCKHFRVAPRLDSLVRNRNAAQKHGSLAEIVQGPPLARRPLGADMANRVIAMTLTDTPAEATHWRPYRFQSVLQPQLRQSSCGRGPKFVNKPREVGRTYCPSTAHGMMRKRVWTAPSFLASEG